MRIEPKLVVVGIVAALLTGCGQSQNSHDTVHLITDASGIQYADLVEGTGEPCEYHDVVLVHYTSFLANGKQINTSHDGAGPAVVRLGVGMVIRGWDIGIPGMKVGGKRKLVMPSHLAFGEEGKPQDGIPGKAEITAVIELVSIKEKARHAKDGGNSPAH
jgi:FKBP-type peptidyl-prolyl cis-trans isomerase